MFRIIWMVFGLRQKPPKTLITTPSKEDDAGTNHYCHLVDERSVFIIGVIY